MRVPGTRRRFSDTFKAAAVRLVPDEGKSVGAVARELDATASAPSLGDSFPQLGTPASRQPFARAILVKREADCAKAFLGMRESNR